MGMSYEELSAYGRLRKIERCGPRSMFLKLAAKWSHLHPMVVADKVSTVFVCLFACAFVCFCMCLCLCKLMHV